MKSILVQDGQNIFDIAIKTYGIENLYKLIQENDFIESIDYDFAANPGKSVTYDESYKIPKTEISSVTSEAVSTIGEFKGTEGQNLYDLCLQKYGSIEMMYKFIQDNLIVNLNEDKLSERVFTFNKEMVQDNRFHNYLNSKNLVLNTGNLAVGVAIYRVTEDAGVTTGIRITEDSNYRIVD